MEPVGEELERLARLRASGDITEAEFEVLKARVLEGVSAEEPDPAVVDQEADRQQTKEPATEPDEVEAPPELEITIANDVSVEAQSGNENLVLEPDESESVEPGLGDSGSERTQPSRISKRQMAAFGVILVAVVVIVFMVSKPDPHPLESTGCSRSNDLWLCSGVDLHGLDLSGADLTGADLREADLSGADLSGADLSGADLTGALADGGTIWPADFDPDVAGAYAIVPEADLSGVDLFGVDLSGADLSGADLFEADLSGADLSGADLFGVDLSGANLREADLSGANLREADLSGADLREADLSGANLTEADLSGAYLFEADLFGADLSGVDLTGVDLRRADLRRANLDGADLRETDLTNARLDGADLRSSVLTNTVLTDIRYTTGTSWPDGFSPPPTATTRPPTTTTRPPTTTTTASSDLVAVDFWPVVDESTCVSGGTGVMRCLVGIGKYEGQSVSCLSLGVMGWRCIAYVSD